MLTTSEALMVQRALPSVPPPHWEEMDPEELFDNSGGVQLAKLEAHFLRQGRLRKADVIAIVQKTGEILRTEDNLLRLEEPVTIVGDLHGQFYDLMKLFSIGGEISSSNKYLFLGDYVDRGCFGCECILYLLSAKMTHPKNIFLLRGNHETRHLTSFFNFREECLWKYDRQVYDTITETFDTLPLAALVNNKFFCVHGGLSPDISNVEDVMLLHRFREVPSKGAMCDLLWSDPNYDVENATTDTTDRSNHYTPSGAFYETAPSFMENQQRGCSYLYNFACVKHFISVNKLLCVIRAHEAQDEGYKLYRPHPSTNFPCLLSIFSAPNYCDSFDNKGAIVRVEASKLNIRQYYSSPHPYILPNFMNGFQWSLPFLVDKVNSVMSVFLGEEGASDNQSNALAGAPVPGAMPIAEKA